MASSYSICASHQQRQFRYFGDLLFLFASAIYLTNRLILPILNESKFRFLRFYANDLLLVPVALPPVLFLYRLLALRTNDGFPTLKEISLHVLVWSLVCEWIGPLLLNQGVADILDVLIYSIGGCLSYFIWLELAQDKNSSTGSINN